MEVDDPRQYEQLFATSIVDFLGQSYPDVGRTSDNPFEMSHTVCHRHVVDGVDAVQLDTTVIRYLSLALFEITDYTDLD